LQSLALARSILGSVVWAHLDYAYGAVKALPYMEHGIIWGNLWKSSITHGNMGQINTS